MSVHRINDFLFFKYCSFSAAISERFGHSKLATLVVGVSGECVKDLFSHERYTLPARLARLFRRTPKFNGRSSDAMVTTREITQRTDERTNV